MAVYKIFSRTEQSTDAYHKKNEDTYMYTEISFVNDEKILIILVADGMGGLEDGDKASRNAVEAFFLKMQELLFHCYMDRKNDDYSLTDEKGKDKLVELIKEAVVFANHQVFEKAGPFVRTGTTLSSVILLGTYAVVANVGDSPVYYYNEREQVLKLVSKLQTKAELDVEKGLYSRYSDMYYSNDHLLSKSLGKEVLSKDDIYVNRVGYINAGDMFLAGSDGSFGRMQEKEILDLVNDKDEYNVLKKLFERAREDKEDDQTAVLYKAR